MFSIFFATIFLRAIFDEAINKDYFVKYIRQRVIGVKL
jgi:hypothetical protein